MGLERREVDFDHTVEELFGRGLDFGVGLEVLGDRVGGGDDLVAAGGLQVAAHGVVVAEGGAGGAHFGAHVADGRLAGGAQGTGAVAEVLHDGVGAALDGEDPGQLQDHVLRGGEPLQLAGQLHADQLRVLQLPGEADHGVHGVGSAHADREHAEAARVHGVRVGPDHHSAGEGVVLEHHLVDDARAREPAVDTVLGRDRLQEVVDLRVLLFRAGEVLAGPFAGDDQVVAVDRAGDGDLGLARGGELEEGHLGGGVLHGHAVGVELGEIGAARVGALFGPGDQVGVEDLLGERQGAAQGGAGGGDPFGVEGVGLADGVEVEEHGVLLGRGMAGWAQI